MNDLLSCKQLDRAILKELFSLAQKIEDNPKKFSKSLSDKVVATLFFEPSTRTRLSFEAAILRLGGQNISVENGGISSSKAKGESLEDTIMVVGSYSDGLIIRHSDIDWAERAQKISLVPIINAGSGGGEHPTQALLDVYTALRLRGKIDGIKVALLGDLRFGRTVHSLIHLLSFYEDVKVYGLSCNELSLPSDYLSFMEKKGIQYRALDSFEDLPLDLDIIYNTRIQKERFVDSVLPKEFVIDPQSMSRFPLSTFVLHPLPRNNEICPSFDSDPRAAYFEQAKNGLYVRMALLLMLLT